MKNEAYSVPGYSNISSITSETTQILQNHLPKNYLSFGRIPMKEKNMVLSGKKQLPKMTSSFLWWSKFKIYWFFWTRNSVLRHLTKFNLRSFTCNMPQSKASQSHRSTSRTLSTPTMMSWKKNRRKKSKEKRKKWRKWNRSRNKKKSKDSEDQSRQLLCQYCQSQKLSRILMIYRHTKMTRFWVLSSWVTRPKWHEDLSNTGSMICKSKSRQRVE